MAKCTQRVSQAEVQRRQHRSREERELSRRREQSARDRAIHARAQARTVDQSFQRASRALIQHIHISLPIEWSACIANPLESFESVTMPPALPWKAESKSTGAFNSLFNNHKYSDATVYLGWSKVPYPAHRLVLGIRSPYFDDALQSGFKEGTTNEFYFEEDSSHALLRALQYIYTGDYSDEPSEILASEGDDLELLRHPRVFALADMFRMEDLQKLSCMKFELQLQQHWISDTFPDCIREVYSTSREFSAIRQVIVDVMSSHKQELLGKRPFLELIREVGDFAADVVSKLAAYR